MKFRATLCFVAFHTVTLCCGPEKSCKGVLQPPLWISHTSKCLYTWFWHGWKLMPRHNSFMKIFRQGPATNSLLTRRRMLKVWISSPCPRENRVFGFTAPSHLIIATLVNPWPASPLGMFPVSPERDCAKRACEEFPAHSIIGKAFFMCQKTSKRCRKSHVLRALRYLRAMRR